MDFVYVRGKPEGPHEKRVAAAGFRWMQTNRLNPTSMLKHLNPTGNIPDRLPPHSHHGVSTHLIVEGDLRIERVYDSYELSNAPGAIRQDLVPPETTYSATSKNGCSFVEGHYRLSPRTAERFLDRGTLRAVNSGLDALPDDETLKSWLLQVEFDPRGKACPDGAKGEKAILDIRKTNPPMCPSIHFALSKWFEKEWEPKDWYQRRPAADADRNCIFVLLFAVFVGLIIRKFVSAT
ncbi:hypothetical protein GGS21DRAFT_146319 [Xylaria nigripes]|nr:hypothetical protein GGS21DRAFT_146319 [Xylaria nigripes]